MIQNFMSHDTEVDGVDAISIASHASYVDEAFVSCGWAPPMILVDNRLAIADRVLRSMDVIHSSREPLPGVRFGPGGRRHYRFVTDELINRMIERTHSDYGRSDRERSRQLCINEFVNDVFDFTVGEESNLTTVV